jgi:Ca-activated chloride channel family protein
MLVQAPTSNKQKLLTAIDVLRPQLYTAIGSGLLAALDAIFDRSPAESFEAPPNPNAPLLPDKADKAPPPVAPGSFTSAAVVLLSDGQSNQGPSPVEAANTAANLGVRVYTVGVGTKQGAIINFGTFSFHAILDEATLKQIAGVTGGNYFKASSAGELRRIYRLLSTRLMMEKDFTEITALFAGLAVILFMTAGILSVVWFNRML